VVSACGAESDGADLDIGIELIAEDGVSLALPMSHFRPLAPQLVVRLSKWPWLYDFGARRPHGQVLQTCELRLSDSVEANPRFDPRESHVIGLRFDWCLPGRILLDRVGLYPDG
jgi:hypothetical protein